VKHSPATARNRESILAALRGLAPEAGLLLEIASGTGEHAAYLAPRLGAGLIWQPSDGDQSALSGINAHARASCCPRIRPALHLDVCQPAWPIARADAIFCANMLHIAPWEAAIGLFNGSARLLAGNGPLIVYGPFKREGAHTAPSNAQFDADLRARDPRWGLRCLDREVAPLALTHGLALDGVVAMPANNLLLVFRPKPP
jgi:hypothetical protein